MKFRITFNNSDIESAMEDEITTLFRVLQNVAKRHGDMNHTVSDFADADVDAKPKERAEKTADKPKSEPKTEPKEQPKTETPKGEAPPQENAAKPSITLAGLRQRFKAVAADEKYGREKVKEILKEFGVENVSSLKESDYDAVLKRLEALQ